MKTTENIIAAINAAGYAEMVSAAGFDVVTVSILDAEADECIAALRKHLPRGAVAEFAGSSNTDAEGDTTEDIRIQWDA